MIQRIQTFFLLLTSTSAFLLFYFPLFNRVEINFSTSDDYIMKFFAAFVCILSLTNIFMYRNRKIQIKLGWTIIAVTIIYTIILFFFFFKNVSFIQFHLGAYLIIFIFIFTSLANFFIAKDDRLMNSMNRLR